MGAIVSITALLAGSLLVTGLVLDVFGRSRADEAPSSFVSAFLWLGCFFLLAVPLARNAGIIAIERRARLRAAAAVIGFILFVVYAAAFLHVRGGS